MDPYDMRVLIDAACIGLPKREADRIYEAWLAGRGVSADYLRGVADERKRVREAVEVLLGGYPGHHIRTSLLPVLLGVAE